MRFILMIFTLALLAGCTTVETYHNACIEGHATIAAQTACVKANIMQDEYLREDTLAQEYVRTGEMLSREVAEGRMSEEEAQLKFVQTLNRIKEDELRAQAYRAAIDRANRDMLPRQTECTQDAGRVYCTSY